MANNLVGLGTSNYNGYTFSEKMLTTHLQITPQRDKAGRTTSFARWAISIKDPITCAAGSTLDATMRAARLALDADGGSFVYQNKGMGDLVVNTPGNGNKWDVNWGPKCTGFRFEMDGRDQSWTLYWDVEVCVPEHCSNAAYQFAIMAFTFNLRFTTDRQGYTTRYYTGELHIPQTRASVNNKSLQATADQYFESIQPVIPPGFRPGQRDHALDESKNILTFTIVHEETPPTSLQVDVIDADAGHSISSISGTNLNQWQATIRGRYTMGRHANPSQALIRFLDLAWIRMRNTNIVGVDLLGNAGFAVIPQNLSMDQNDIFGRESGVFSLTYRFTCSLALLLAASQLWKPVPQGEGVTNYADWINSVAFPGGPLSLRGNAQMRVSPSDDALVDLCPSGIATLKAQGSVANDQDDGFNQILRTFFPAPSPSNSWMKYDCEIKIVTNPGTSVISSLPQSKLTQFSVSPPLDLEGILQSDSGSPFTSSLSTVPPSTDSNSVAQLQNQNNGSTPGGTLINDITGQTMESGNETVQYNQNPEVYVWLIGGAMRACYPIPYPILQAFGNCPVIPQGNSMVSQKLIGGEGGLPIIGAKWAICYRVLNPGAGAALGVMPDPSAGIG